MHRRQCGWEIPEPKIQDKESHKGELNFSLGKKARALILMGLTGQEIPPSADQCVHRYGVHFQYRSTQDDSHRNRFGANQSLPKGHFIYWYW